jgi:hypothetical protein
MLLQETVVVHDMPCVAPTAPCDTLLADDIKHLNLEQLEYFTVSRNGSEEFIFDISGFILLVDGK